MNVLGALYQGRFGVCEIREGFYVRVGVMDARRDGGRVRLLVTPAAAWGQGETWVNEDRVRFDETVTGPDGRD